MTEANFYLTMASSALIGLAMLITAGLSAWRGWLKLKSEQLVHNGPADEAPSIPTTTGTRIELADLKERIRKLEAIAAGVDL